MKIQVLVKATNATLYLGLGFKPDRVRIQNLDDRTELLWNRKAVKEQPYGETIAAAGDKADAASAAAGLVLYDGSAYQAAASSAILVMDKADYKGDITKWTTDTAGSKTGHFDAAMNTTYSGVGSKVVFNDGTVATITALTDDGDASDDVTLDVLPGDSQVVKIFPWYDMRACTAGSSIPAGITIGASATINDTSGDDLLIEAETFDN